MESSQLLDTSTVSRTPSPMSSIGLGTKALWILAVS